MDIQTENSVQENESSGKIRRKQVTKHIGKSVDCGTGFLVAASINDSGNISFKTERNAFFDVENNNISRNMLTKLKASFVPSDDNKRLFILGEKALEIAGFFNAECRRPFAKGVVSTREPEALSIIKTMLHGLVGDPSVENEKLCFSVPADPVDVNFNNVYHENVLKSFLTSFGYNAEPLNEAHAIVLAELEDEDYSGLALSFGAGSINISLSISGMTNKQQQFCIARSGDWVDENAAICLGIKASAITPIKEMGVDLLNPKSREETAIKIYYENLIKYTCNIIEKKFNSSENIMNCRDPLTVVISGGTSKAINFDKLFEQEIMSKNLPFKISKIKKASDPLNAVAKGCLLNALNS
jgi:hypothetical protein